MRSALLQSPTLGLSLALLAITLGCASTPDGDEDPFVPPSRPLVYSAGRSGECPPAASHQKRPPRGALPTNKKLPTWAGEPVEGAIAVAHGGVGSPPELSDGPETAAKLALDRMEGGAPALDAAIDATASMEDDPRFNAGTGSNIRLDGKTIQMDASLMTGDGAFAAVAVIERVKNPIRVARAVLDSPHILLAGEGATRFAHRMGFEDVVPISKEAEARYRDRMERLKKQVKAGGRDAVDWTKIWNFPDPIPKELADLEHGDTVGTVTRDREGKFAVTLSTGGTSFTLYGRVGDVPIFGAGAYAGPDAAIACTGDGEVIVKQGLARRAYEEIAAGTPARLAVQRAVLDFPEGGTVGIIAVDRIGFGVAANKSMAFGVAYAKEEK